MIKQGKSIGGVNAVRSLIEKPEIQKYGRKDLPRAIL